MSAQAMGPYLALLTSPGGETDSRAGGRCGGQFRAGSSFMPRAARPKKRNLKPATSALWGAGFGAKDNFSANATTGVPAVSGSLADVALGFENQLSRALMLGLSIAGGTENFSAGLNGKGRSTDLTVALYGQLRFGSLSLLNHVYVAGAIAYGKRQVSTTRSLTLSGTDTLNGKFGAHDIGGRTGDRLATGP